MAFPGEDAYEIRKIEDPRLEAARKRRMKAEEELREEQERMKETLHHVSALSQLDRATFDKSRPPAGDKVPLGSMFHKGLRPGGRGASEAIYARGRMEAAPGDHPMVQEYRRQWEEAARKLRGKGLPVPSDAQGAALSESIRVKERSAREGKDVWEVMDEEEEEKEKARKASIRAKIAAEPEEDRIMRIAEAKARKKVLQGMGVVRRSGPDDSGETKKHLVDHVQKLRQFSTARGKIQTEQQERFEVDDEMVHELKHHDHRNHLRKTDYTEYVEALMRAKGRMGS